MKHSLRLQTRVTTGRWTLPAVTFACTFCWALVYLLLPELPVAGGDSSPALWQPLCPAEFPEWAKRLLSYLVYAAAGYFLIELNNRFAIIRIRASVQTTAYFLFVTACPELHQLHMSGIAFVPCLVSLYFLLGSYQSPHASGHLFYSFLFLGLGSLCFPPITYLSLFWIAEARAFQSLSLRSFCAALLGWALPYWFLFAHAFFYNQMELFYEPFRLLVSFGPFFRVAQLSPGVLATGAYLLVLFAVSATHCLATGFEDKIRTRAYLRFFIRLNLLLFVVLLLQPGYADELLPLLMAGCSVLTGHFFALTHSKASNAFFIVTTGSLLPLFVFNLWMLL